MPMAQRTAVRSIDANDPDMHLLVETDLSYLVGGAGDSKDFVQLGICMSRSQGSYGVRKSSLCDPQPHFIGYLAGHMPYVNRYTLAAVVLAAGVLVDRPDALVEAAEEMLRAPELL